MNEHHRHERDRLDVLARYGGLLTIGAPECLELVKLAAKVLEAPVALITLVGNDRVAFTSRFGTTVTEAPSTHWFCCHVVHSQAPLVVENAPLDQRFALHEYVSSTPGFRFYAGSPLRTPDEDILGTLCVLDFCERAVGPTYIEILESLGKQVMTVFELQLQRRLLATQLSHHESKRRQIEESRALTSHSPQVHDQLVGQSTVMQALYDQIAQVAQGDWSVLIEGETGAGKELVAQAIHRASSRSDARFIPVNCAGLTESIFGSQLFGHVKGAFTGASTGQQGFFEAADGGTLFLDEIGDMPQAIQGVLLRALQEHEVTRIGETLPRKANVRVITATNQSLRQRVKNGLFRQDLYYRIRSARIRVAPLRDHREDIPQLVDAFLADERINVYRSVTGISLEAMQLLKNYDWPGNVRELRGAIEYAVSRCKTGRIELTDLPIECVEGRSLISNALGLVPDDERSRIVSALEKTGGSKVKAAKLLGIARATLYRRIKELGIDPIKCVRF